MRVTALFEHDRLARWLDAVQPDLPLPPPGTWTCLARLMGPHARLWTDDAGHVDLVDREVIAALLRTLGRPVRPGEALSLLLCTPVPSSLDLATALGDLLRHPEYGVRQRAALLLGRLGLHRAVPALLEAVGDGDDDVRAAAWEALGRLGGADADAAISGWPAWDAYEAVNLARLVAVGRRRLWWQAELALPDASGRAEASTVHLLRSVSQGDVAALSELLEHREVFARCAAVLAVDPQSPGVIEPLVHALVHQDDRSVIDRIIEALSAGGPDALELLLEQLEGPDGHGAAVACEALAALGWMGTKDPAVEAPLRAMLESDDGDVVAAAVVALHQQGCSVAGLEPRLWTWEADKSARRARFLHGLRSTAPLRAIAGLEEAGPDLAGVLARDVLDEALAEVGCLALALGRPDVAAPVLDALARDGRLGHDVRAAAAAGLMVTGTPPSVLPAVHRLLLFESADRGDHASTPTGGTREDELVAVALVDADWRLRLAALRRIGRMGEATVRQVRGALRAVADRDDDDDVRTYARSLLGESWHESTPGDLLAVLLAPSGRSIQRRVHALIELDRRDPSLGAVACAHVLLQRGGRDVCRQAARITGRRTTSDRVRDVVNGVVPHLVHEDYDVREDAVLLLGSVPRAAWPDALREEVLELLVERRDHEHDDDVTRALAGAIGALVVASSEEP